MAHEVEMKVWVTDWNAASRLLHDRCTFRGSVLKRDRYFRRPEEDPGSSYGFRVRLDGEVATVTYKDRLTKDGVERNVEHEFHVDDAETFVRMAERLGCSQYMTKTKEGEEFICGELTIGLYHVLPVGDFLEVEAVVADADSVADAAESVRDFIKALTSEMGVESPPVESRSYGKLVRLAEAGELSSRDE